MDNPDRCRYYVCGKLLFHSSVQLCSICMGDIFLLLQHDGGKLYMGAKALPHSLCMEEVACIHDNCFTAFLSASRCIIVYKYSFFAWSRHCFYYRFYFIYFKN